MARIVLVEDDRNLREALSEVLADEGHEVRAAATLAEGREALDDHRPDVVVLDVMLPDGDGGVWCKALKASASPPRVLMLTARTLEDDVVRGFDAGADDYVAKPYRLKELLARIAALARRGPSSSTSRYALGAFVIDLTSRTVRGPTGEVALTKKEFDLLVCLRARAGAVVSRDVVLDEVWGDVVVDVHTVDNFVSSLKKKLKGPGFELKTVRGVGFRLDLVP